MFERPFFEKLEDEVAGYSKASGVGAVTVTFYTEEHSYNVVKVIKVTEEVVGFHYYDEAKQRKVRGKDGLEGPAFPVMFLRLEDVAAVEFNPGDAAKKFGFGK